MLKEQQEKLVEAHNHSTHLTETVEQKDRVPMENISAMLKLSRFSSCIAWCVCVQELQEARSRVSELERTCSESEILLDREKSSTASLQQQLTDEQGSASKVCD